MLRLHSKQVELGLQLHGKSLWSLCPWQAALRELSPLMTGECKAANVKDEIVWAISATCQLTKIYSTKISCCSHMFQASQMLRIGRLGDVHCIWQDPDKLLQAARRCPIAIEVRNEFALVPSEGFHLWSFSCFEHNMTHQQCTNCFSACIPHVKQTLFVEYEAMVPCQI